MEFPESNEGIWRKVIGASVDPALGMVDLELECGHHLKVRFNTPMGDSWRQTQWTGARCCQCEGSGSCSD